MRTLYDLFEGWTGRRIHKWHHYLPIYERYFDRFRGRPFTLVEIGLGEGGSLELWRQFLGPRVRIVGIDVDPKCEAYRAEGVEIFIGDQADPHFLRRVLDSIPPPDLVIDDGGHKASQQIASFEAIYPCMPETGIYIVEDVHTSYWANWKDRADGLTFIEYSKRMCDSINAWYRDEMSYGRYYQRPEDRPGEMEVPWFTRNTRCISFYDAMVIFERCTREEPRHSERPFVLRDAGGAP